MSPGRLLARTLHIQKHISTPSSTLPNAAPKPRTMATDAGASPTAAPRKLKILMLHGYTQSGPSFHAKTRALEKSLGRAFPASPAPGALPRYPGGVQLLYPTAPHRLRASQIPGYAPSEGGGGADEVARVAEEDEIDAWAWWRRDEATGLYLGLDEGLARIAETIRAAGGVDGVVGFSQGGAAAAIVASLLETGRREAMEAAAAAADGLPYPEAFGEVSGPLEFAVSYSGFFAPHARYAGLYEPRIRTPVLHVIGSLDTVVEEGRVRGLVERCEGGEGRVVVHPGGHFVPVGREWVGALVGFIREVVGGVGKKEEVEESVEDMDMPF